MEWRGLFMTPAEEARERGGFPRIAVCVCVGGTGRVGFSPLHAAAVGNGRPSFVCSSRFIFFRSAVICLSFLYFLFFSVHRLGSSLFLFVVVASALGAFVSAVVCSGALSSF